MYRLWRRIQGYLAAIRGAVANPRAVKGFAAALDQESGERVAAIVKAALPPDEALRVGLKLLREAHATMTFERDGTRWSISSGDDILEEVFLTGRYEGPELSGLLAWLKEQHSADERNTVVDIGANVGTTTIPMARRGFRVLAVEPAPDTFALLLTNVRANGLDAAVTCLNAAVSTVHGDVQIAIGDGLGQSEVVAAAGQQTLSGGEPIRRVVRVRSEPLTSLVKESGAHISKIALVWCDTQGSETDVITSGEGLWDSGVPLYAEVWPKGLQSHAGTEAFLKAVERHFKFFVSGDDLVSAGSRAQRQEIAGFRAFFHGITEYSNALLLPELPLRSERWQRPRG